MNKKILLKNYSGIRVLTSEKSLEKMIYNTENFLDNQGDYETSKEFKSRLEEIKEFFKTTNAENVEFYTKSYLKAAIDSSECIKETLTKYSKKNNNDILEGLANLLELENVGNSIEGAMIDRNDPQCLTYILYNFKVTDTGFQLKISRWISLDKIGSVLCEFINTSNLFLTKLQNEKFLLGGEWSGYINKTYIPDDEDKDDSIANDIFEIIRLIAFKHLAKTEFEQFDLVDDSKLKSGLSRFQIEREIENLETKITVDYYSANWYKEIIVNHGFGVKGHWRNQPYKTGYKMIFIKPFQKHGYHRKAEKDQPELKETT